MTATKTQRLRVGPSRGLENGQGVDRNKNVIYGASIATMGPTRDGRMELDEVTLENIVAVGNQLQQEKRGVKARFTHPNLSDDGMGKYLGRWKNFRRDGKRVRADLYLSIRSFNTPNGNLGAYVLGMAESEPSAFGVSIQMRDWELVEQEDKGNQEKAGESELPLLRVGSLWAADVVDEPAANDGLFLSETPAGHATAFLDRLFENNSAVEIRQYVGDFLDKYLSLKKGDSSMAQNDQSTDVDKKDVADAADLKDAKAVLSEKTISLTQEQFDAKLAEARAEGLAEGKQNVKKQVDDATKSVEDATFALASEVTALCKAAGHPDMDTELLSAKLSLDQVRAKLLDKMCEDLKVLGDGGEPDRQAKKDPAAKYRAEFRASGGKKAHGVTEEQYVASSLRTEAGGVIEFDED